MAGTTFSLRAMERILRAAGAERVSDDAKRALAERLEKLAAEIARDAVRLAKHAGRKTLAARDLEV